MEWRLYPHYVYECVQDGVVVYIGCTGNPENRIKGLRRSAWWTPETVARITHGFADRREAYQFEHAQIVARRPRFNRQGVREAA